MSCLLFDPRRKKSMKSWWKLFANQHDLITFKVNFEELYLIAKVRHSQYLEIQHRTNQGKQEDFQKIWREICLKV